VPERGRMAGERGEWGRDFGWIGEGKGIFVFV